jgi:hypothetical protein
MQSDSQLRCNTAILKDSGHFFGGRGRRPLFAVPGPKFWCPRGGLLLYEGPVRGLTWNERDVWSEWAVYGQSLRMAILASSILSSDIFWLPVSEKVTFRCYECLRCQLVLEFFLSAFITESHSKDLKDLYAYAMRKHRDNTFWLIRQRGFAWFLLFYSETLSEISCVDCQQCRCSLRRPRFICTLSCFFLVRNVSSCCKIAALCLSVVPRKSLTRPLKDFNVSVFVSLETSLHIGVRYAFLGWTMINFN